jgi:hypothetical protein
MNDVGVPDFAFCVVVVAFPVLWSGVEMAVAKAMAVAETVVRRRWRWR